VLTLTVTNTLASSDVSILHTAGYAKNRWQPLGDRVGFFELNKKLSKAERSQTFFLLLRHHMKRCRSVALTGSIGW